MQGVFNVNWDGLVNPDLDEKTALERNKRQSQDEEPKYFLSVHPPDLEFTIYHENKELRIFVVEGNSGLSKGEFGHYIKPYAIHQINTKKYTIPYPKPKKKINEHFIVYPGTPGYPYPPKEVLDQFSGHQHLQATLNALNRLGRWNTIDFKKYFTIQDNVQNYFTTNDEKDLFAVEKRSIFAEYENTLAQNDDRTADPHYLPDTMFSQEGVDFIRASPDSTFYEIGKDYLCQNVKRAEELDYEFSKKIQGLIGSTSDFVWSCLDPDFDPMDRNKLLNIYLENYIKENAKTSKSDPDFRAVATEEVQQHKAFCQEWVKKNYKTLTPAVTSTAELLVSEFYPYIKGRMSREYPLTIPQLCRVFMRHPKFSSQFSICLQNYMQNIENTRSGRNPSYKQITTVQISKALAFKTFVNYMEANRSELKSVYDETSNLSPYHFHLYTVDWHYIVGKLPDIHHHYKKLRFSKEDNDEELPPWLIGNKKKKT